MAALATLLAAALLAQGAWAAVPIITKLAPSRGYRAGQFRVRIEGKNLVFLPDQAQVMVGRLPCTDIRVEEPWAALSCMVPACPGCTEEPVRVNVGGQVSDPLPMQFTGMCEGPQLIESRPRPKLPAEYSGKENCTICRLLVSLSLSAVPDLVSYESIRVAMRDSCGSPMMRNYHMLDKPCKKNLRDFFVPCAALLFAEQDQLLDMLWSRWDDEYDLGGLADLACRQVGRCGGAEGLAPEDL